MILVIHDHYHQNDDNDNDHDNHQIVDFMTLPPLFLSIWLERSWIGLRFFRCFFIVMIFVCTSSKNFIHHDGDDDAIDDAYDNDNDVGGS